jgi:hypothetical protein
MKTKIFHFDLIKTVGLCLGALAGLILPGVVASRADETNPLAADDKNVPGIQHVESQDNDLIDAAFKYGCQTNLVTVNAAGRPMPTLSINNCTADNPMSYSVWTRDLYWGFLGWAQSGDDAVLPVMKSSLQLLVLAKNKNQALGQNPRWPLHDGRYYIPQAYMVHDFSIATGYYPWNSESQADFLLLAGNYWKLSGDRVFMQSIWKDIVYVTQTLQLLDTDGNSLPDATQGTYDYQSVRHAEEPLMCAKTSLAYSSVAEIARALGENTYAADLEKLARKIKETMNREVRNGGLWDSSNGCYVDMRMLTKTGSKINDTFIPYENLVPIWCGMTSRQQNREIFAKLDRGYDQYYARRYGPEYCAPAKPNEKSGLDCSSVPWLGFLDVYLRGKTGNDHNRSKIYHLLIQHAGDAAGIPFSEGAGISANLTGNAGRTWDNGNFFHMLICGIYGLEKSREGIHLTAPEKIDGVPLTELRNVQWRQAVYDFQWQGAGAKIRSVTLDGDEKIPRSSDGFNLTTDTGRHEVSVQLE